MTTTGLTFRSRKEDGSILYDCPDCGGRGKLELTRDHRLWYCHKCGEGGKTRSDPHDRKKWIVAGREQERTYTSEEFSPIEKTDDPRYRYLSEKRGLTPNMIHDLRPHSGGQWYIVYFPVYALDNDNSPVYFVGRSLFNDEPKYRNPPLSQFPLGGKSKNLWGLHRLYKRTQSLVLCEGVFDAVWSRNRVALMGRVISEHQVKIIRRIEPQEITVFLDGDAGKDSMLIAKILANRVSVPIWVVDTPRGKDPDDLGKGFVVNDHRRRIA